MAPKTSNAQLMCAHQLRPALILDTHGVVTGVNQGILRMIAPSQPSAPQEEHDPLIGRNISQLGLELQSRRPQVLSSWSDLLDAAVHVKGSDDPQDATAANSIAEIVRMMLDTTTTPAPSERESQSTGSKAKGRSY
jgi:hypothetical protein